MKIPKRSISYIQNSISQSQNQLTIDTHRGEFNDMKFRVLGSTIVKINVNKLGDSHET